jgi:hypothetical protein
MAPLALCAAASHAQCTRVSAGISRRSVQPARLFSSRVAHKAGRRAVLVAAEGEPYFAGTQIHTSQPPLLTPERYV